MDEFYHAYETAIVKGQPLHLTEKPEDPSPMRADLDFRFLVADTSSMQRAYTFDDIQRITVAYFEILYAYLDAPQEHFVAYVMEKTKPSEYRGKMKDGLHIVWPHLVVPHTMMHLVRKHILDGAANMFQGLPLSNTFEDVIDQAIIDRNNWQMYGSKKPDSEPYRVTHVLAYDPDTKGLTALPGPTASDELQYIRLFSMRGKKDKLVPLRPEKQEQMEEFERHVLPTLMNRRNKILHEQVFSKSSNVTKTFVSDDELELAKKLVLECLNQTARSENYENWIRLGWTLRNIDYRLLETWIDFSKVSSKYVEGECQSLWNKMRNESLGMGTLRWWAREDNRAKYEEILNSNIVTLIDKCIGTDGAHFDVACVVHAMYKDKYRFTVKDIWYMFDENKHRWVRTKEGLKLRMVLSGEVCTKFMQRSLHWNQEASRQDDSTMQDLYGEKAKKLSQIATRLKTAGYKDSVMKECKALFTDEKFEELLDSNPHLIGFENGVYDLRMHVFREGLPDDFISFCNGRQYVNFDKDSVEAKEIHGYLSQVFTNENVRKYMMDILACIVDGGIRMEAFYIFTGNGSNSKSLFLNMVQKAIGDYYCILPIALLTQKRVASNSAQSELERTKGRRLAVMQEPGENERLNIGLMKELSGQDRLLVRGLFKDCVEFKPQFKMVMTCNELPEVPSDDGGTWRRIRVVEFTSKFVQSPNPNNPREFPLDPELHDKIDRWADMFISMILDHHKHVDPKNIHEPVEVRIATEGYKKNNDVIGQYVSEHLVRDETSTDRVMVQKLFTSFKSWAYQNVQKGKKVPDRNQFRAYMEKTFGAYPSDGKGWRGVRYLHTDAQGDSDVE
jgi:P4 family phage/plasmid primase-like protien